MTKRKTRKVVRKKGKDTKLDKKAAALMITELYIAALKARVVIENALGEVDRIMEAYKNER